MKRQGFFQSDTMEIIETIDYKIFPYRFLIFFLFLNIKITQKKKILERNKEVSSFLFFI